MALDAEAVLVGNRLLQRLDLRVFELDDRTAVSADQMVVMLFTGAGLVAGLAIAEVTGLGDAALGEQLEGAMDRGVTNPRVLSAQAQVELFSREVRPRPQELVENDFSLPSGLESLGDEIGAESFFGFD
jgi:hypothetical protein